MESMVARNDVILVTGGAGFIGGHLVELLLEKRYSVIVADIQKAGNTYFFKQKLDQKVDYKCVDITDKKSIGTLFFSAKPHYIIHLAAMPIVEESYLNPWLTFETNIMGTVNILEACRNTKSIKGIIVASSDKAYGKTKTKESYTEDSPLKGDHPYDVSKSCEDLIAQTYFKTYRLPVVVTRFGNVYGEGDLHVDRIIPGICKALATGDILTIRSDGTYVRDYIYVKDVAQAYFFLMQKLRDIKGEVFNVSSTENYSVLNLIDCAQSILKQKIPYIIANTVTNEIPYQHLDDTKIRSYGYKTNFSLGSTLPKIYAWYKRFL